MSQDNERIFEALDLDESSVAYLMQELQSDISSNPIQIQVISPKFSANPSEIVLFNPKELVKHSQDIDFMFGQLLMAHTPNAKYFTPEAGCMNYDRVAWTQDADTLLQFYALGIANKTMMPFRLSKDKTIISMLDPNLIPTMRDIEPAFPEWVKQYKLQYKPKFKSGREPQEEK